MTKPNTKPCPICHEPIAEQQKDPFCSKRCADIDLHRWFSGRYAIPAEAVSDELLEDEERNQDALANLSPDGSYLN